MASERIRLDKLLSNRGYCTRSEALRFLRHQSVCEDGAQISKVDQKVLPDLVTIDSKPLDPSTGMVVLLNKPTGFVCSHKDTGRLIYELLPGRWSQRNPTLTSVGRLDKETSGLLVLTDDGSLNHRLTSPKKKVPKKYQVHLEFPLKGNEVELFASGTMLLDGEREPLLPSIFEPLSETSGCLTIFEGRYHQVRRMFESLGNTVVALHRSQIGLLTLDGLPENEWRFLSSDDVAKLFSSQENPI